MGTTAGPRWGVPELARALSDLGLPVGDGDVHDDHVRTALSGDDPEHPRPARFTLTSSATGAAEELLVVETTYPFAVPDADTLRLGGALLAPYLVLGRIDLVGETLQHRYATVVDTATSLPANVLRAIVAVVDYEQLHFGDYLEVLSNGEATIDTFSDVVRRSEELDTD